MLKNPTQQNYQPFSSLLWPASRGLATLPTLFAWLALAALAFWFPAAAEAVVSASSAAGSLTDLLNSNSDSTVLSTTTSGAVIQVAGTGFATTIFPGITNMAVLFGGSNQSATFDSSAFSFASGITINSWGAAINDSVVKIGANTLTITGASNYLGGTTISGGVLQIGKGGATGSIVGNVVDNALLIFDRGDAFTFAGNITGSGSLTKDGAGTLTLSGTGSNYAGGTTVNSGILKFGNVNSLGTGEVTLGIGTELHSTANAALANQVMFAQGGTSDVSATAGTTLTIGSLRLGDMTPANAVFGSAGNTGTVIIGPATGSYGANSASTIEVAFGTLRNGGTAGQGLAALTGNSAATTVDLGATLDVNDKSLTITNLLGAGSVTLGTNATTALTANAGAFMGAIKGAGQLNKSTAGTLELTGANTYTGGTTINGGTLQIGDGGTNGSIAGNVTDNASLVFDRGDSLIFAGNITGGGSLTKNGAGTLTLTGTGSNYSNGTTINGGVLGFSNSKAVGIGPINLGIGTELRSTATATLANQVIFAQGGTSIISAAAGKTLTLGSLQLGDSTPANAVFGSAGNTGTVVIGPATGNFGANPASTVEVAFGTLRNGGTVGQNLAAFIANIAQITVDSGATFDTNGQNLTLARLQGAGSVTLGNNAATLLTVNAGIFGGAISGAGGLNKSTADTLELTGANTYTGGTTIGVGALQIGNGGTTGSIVGIVTDNADLVFKRSNALTFAGKISGTGVLTQAGAGVLTLTGVNSYSGGTSINAGTVSVNNPSAVGTGNVVLNNGGGLLATSSLTLANSVSVNAGETGVLSAAPSTTVTVNALSNLGNFIFGGAGRTGIITFGPFGSGFTTSNTATVEVAAGTVRNTSGALGYFTSTAASTTIDAGATLDIHDSGVFVANLQGAGTVTLGTNAATNLIPLAGNFSGVISGAGQVTKFSPGALVLAGANTYTGGTTIAGGTLQIGNGGTTGSIVSNVIDNTALIFDRNNALTFGGIISGPGTVTQVGSGTLTLTGANTYTGGTTISTGAIGINNPNTLGPGSILLKNSGGLLATTNLTYSNPVSIAAGDTGSFAATAGATLTVNTLSELGNVVFGRPGDTGAVTLGPLGPGFAINSTSTIEVAAGTLRNTSSTLGYFTSTAASTTVDAGGTLDIHDSGIFVARLQGSGAVTLGTSAATNLILQAGNFGGVISGAGQVTKFSPGTLALSGANSYIGGTVVTGGSLLANNRTGSATGSGPVAVDFPGILGGSGTITGAVTLNAGGVIAPGAGSPGTAGTTLHGSSLLWNGGGQLTLQLGVTADEFALTGALTKGTAGAFTLDLLDAGITQSTYTLATFASTTFSLSDFVLELPANFTGTLVETKTSLVLENLVDTAPHADSANITASFAGDGAASFNQPADSSTAFTQSDTLSQAYPTPEPGSATLFSLAASLVLGWRRRRRR
jgi:autotransporter-associated beta strand protein